MTWSLHIFWMSIFFIFYTVAGYLALLKVLTAFRRRSVDRQPYAPSVAVVISVHNAEKTIRKKLENTLQCDYPKEKLEIVVGSDSSTDRTVDIVREFSDRRVSFVDIRERRGKHYVQEVCVDRTSSEIIIFTDSAIVLDRDALEKITENFADQSVGCVTSEDRIANEAGDNAEGNYVPAEMVLRRLETQIGSVVGVSGSFFAIRREIAAGWHFDESSDFFLPLHCVKQGKRAISDPMSIGYFSAVPSAASEYARKVRTIVHGLVVFFGHLYLLNVFRYGLFSWQLFSHKLCRWLLPLAFFGCLVANALLFNTNKVFGALFILQCILWLSGASAAAFGRLRRVRLLRVLAFVWISTAATLEAWVYFLVGEKYVVWEPSRR